jgi:hypothetical protein
MSGINWDIRREGRRWRPGEMRERYEALPEMKFEVIEGQLLWTQEEQLHLLAVMLEAVGVDRAVRLGDPRIWREAVAHLEMPE